MATSMNKTKLTKSEKRIDKKINRSRVLLNKTYGIESTTDASNVLCVYNGGLGSGVSQEDIYELFHAYGKVEEVAMVPQKPFCFVYFSCKEEAEEACKSLNGHDIKNVCQDSKLYIFFISPMKVPPIIGPSSDLPQGLVLVPDFISREEESQLLHSVNWKDGGDKALKHRRVKHYGYEFKYGINNVDPDEPLEQAIPIEWTYILHRAVDQNLVKYVPDQLTVNQYLPGQGIPPHVDTRSAFEDGIMSLSLGSQVVMDFRHPDGHQLSVLLPPRSLLIMKGDSRYLWSHGITPRKTDIIPQNHHNFSLSRRETRTSFTFRKLAFDKGPILSLADEIKCLPQTEQEAKNLEEQNVHQVYEKIADHFSSTRHSPWPKVVSFLKEQADGFILADIGCGNGKYLGVNTKLYSIGSDRSFGLVNISKDRNHETLISDILNIPFRSNSFDVSICIAVVHHLSTKERRLMAIKELIRIIRPGGKILVYVWALEQERHKVKSKYLRQKKDSQQFENRCDNKTSLTVPITCNQATISETYLVTPTEEFDNFAETPNSDENKEIIEKKIDVHVNRTEFKEQDMFVPWQLKNNDKKIKGESTTYHRFYHVFRQGELEELCLEAGHCQIMKSYYDQGNWCVVLQKK